MGQSASQREHAVQRLRSTKIRRGDNRLKIANPPPKGHRYLHQKRLCNMDVMPKVTSTLQRSGVLSCKPKIARTGQISCRGGYTARMLAIKTIAKTRYFNLRSQPSTLGNRRRGREVRIELLCSRRLGLANLFVTPANKSWIAPNGHIQPQKARPAMKETPNTPNNIEKFNKLVVRSVSPVFMYTHKLSIAPNGQKASNEPA